MKGFADERRTSMRRKRRVRKMILAAVLLFLVFSGISFINRGTDFWIPWGSDRTGQSKGEDGIPAFLGLNSSKRQLERAAEERGFSIEDYPDKLVELYEKNEEARDFVLDYPEKKETSEVIDLGDEVSPGEIPLLMQWDERWGYCEYAGNLFGLSGCGPTCLSMVTIGLTGDTAKNPAWMGEFATQHGYAVDGSGSSWSLMSEGGEELGLDVIEIPAERERVENNLAVGNPVIAIMGPGKFTSTGHFIVLVGMDDEKWIIHDPNSKKNSQKKWEPDSILSEARDLWVFRN